MIIPWNLHHEKSSQIAQVKKKIKKKHASQKYIGKQDNIERQYDARRTNERWIDRIVMLCTKGAVEKYIFSSCVDQQNKETMKKINQIEFDKRKHFVDGKRRWKKRTSIILLKPY